MPLDPSRLSDAEFAEIRRALCVYDNHLAGGSAEPLSKGQVQASKWRRYVVATLLEQLDQ